MKIYDNKISRTVFLLFLLIVSIVLTACPASPPNIEDSDSSLYQKPETPQNVKATNGYKDVIRITWDPVEDVDGYIILGCRSSDFDKGLTQFDIVSGATSSIYTFDATKSNVDVNQSYIFSVVSYKIYNNTERVRSDNSIYTEGSFAPSELSFHAIINDYYVYLYWMSPTLYRQYYTGGEELLYDAEFTVSYGLSSEPVSAWRTITSVDNNSGVTPWLSQRFETNNLHEGDEYSFHVTMNIKDEAGGTVSSLTSSDVTFTASSNMGTTPIKDLTASIDQIDGIHLSWTLPPWTGNESIEDTSKNTFFTIERAISGTSNWEVLVDEADGLVHSKDISNKPEEQTYRYFYVDENVEAGDKFIYRVQNTAVDGKNNRYTHTESMFEPSNEGRLWALEVSSIDGVWTPATDDPNSADVSISWSTNSALKDGLSWQLTKVATNKDGDETKSDVDLTSLSFSDNKYSINFSETISDDDLSYREYSYYLSVYSNGNKLFGEYGEAAFAAEPQQTLGNTLTAINGEDLNKIILTWMPEGVIEGKAYSYGWKTDSSDWTYVDFDIDSVDYVEFEKPNGENNKFTFQLFVDDKPASGSVTQWFLTSVWDVQATKGTVDDRITVSWERNPGADGYEIFYSSSGSEGPFTKSVSEEYGNKTSSTFSHEAGYFNVKAYSYGLDGKKLYTDVGIVPDEKAETAFGTEVAANYGYAFNTEPSIEINNVDGSYFRDNLVFEIAADLSHYRYEINIGEKLSITFNTKDIIDDGVNHEIENANVIYRNGIIEVSTDNFIGTLNNNLTITEDITVKATNSDAKNTTSENFRNIRRGLSDIEIISQVNKILYEGLHAANDSFLEHDWFGSWEDMFIFGWQATGDQQLYKPEGDTIIVSNSYNNNSLNPTPDNNGYASLNGYGVDTIHGTLTTQNGNVVLISRNSEHGLEGFLGVDYLDQIESGSISLDLTSVDSHYKPYTVRYSNVYVNHSEGNYYVTVDGKESVAIPVTDVEQKPY